jgi:uncharacterized protein YfkK (UPF0435 family)
MPSANDYNEQGNNELDEIHTQINKKTNESLESTRNILNMVTQTQEVGVNTMIMLDEQCEKLNRVEVRLFSSTEFFNYF